MKSDFANTMLRALVAAAITLSATAAPPQMTPPGLDLYEGKPRMLVLSDVGNEPDDQMSLVRLLLYSNEIDIEGLVATTSTWQKEKTNPQTMKDVIASYGLVQPNLLKHASGWPTAESLAALVSAGQQGYGMNSVGGEKTSAGSTAIIRAVDRSDRPLWISIWGGANTLAQALRDVRAQRTPAQLIKFVSKLRVYSISDQDDAGPLIRQQFPSLYYVVTPSTPDGEEYSAATWTGISGDRYYRNGDGADFSEVSNEWLEKNIRAKGPLGKHYPRYMFIMEGDTPAFLGFTANGLESFRSPSWGGWGGRYIFRQPYGESRPVWTQGGDSFGRINSQDSVMGIDGRLHTSDQATIWRWRTAFQNDFAARMDWTIKPFDKANHAPIVVVNGQKATRPIFLKARVGESVILDAKGTTDADNDRLTYQWFVYEEAGYSKGVTSAAVNLSKDDGTSTTVVPTATCRPGWLPSKQPCAANGVVHIILAVTDNNSPSLTSYRRIILDVHQ